MKMPPNSVKYVGVDAYITKHAGSESEIVALDTEKYLSSASKGNTAGVQTTLSSIPYPSAPIPDWQFEPTNERFTFEYRGTFSATGNTNKRIRFWLGNVDGGTPLLDTLDLAAVGGTWKLTVECIVLSKATQKWFAFFEGAGTTVSGYKESAFPYRDSLALMNLTGSGTGANDVVLQLAKLNRTLGSEEPVIT
jgi:hypothetical protein